MRAWIVACVSVLGLSACGSLESTMAARVGDTEISIDEVEKAAEAAVGSSGPNAAMTATQRLQNALAEKVNLALLDLAVAEAGEEVTSEDHDTAAQNANATTARQEILARLFALQRAASDRVDPRQYYEAHTSDYFVQVCGEALAVPETDADAVGSRIEAGATVAELAAENPEYSLPFGDQPCVNITGSVTPSNENKALYAPLVLAPLDSLQRTVAAAQGTTFVVFSRINKREPVAYDEQLVKQFIERTNEGQVELISYFDSILRRVAETTPVSIDGRLGAFDPEVFDVEHIARGVFPVGPPRTPIVPLVTEVHDQ